MIVTECDLEPMAACCSVSPRTERLLCIWHMNNNVLTRASTTIANKKNKDNFMHAWYMLVSALTRDQYNDSYDTLFECCQDNLNLMGYLNLQWLIYPWSLLAHWTNQILHLGNTTTSRIEGAQHQLKSYLQFSTGDLTTMVERVTHLLQYQHAEYMRAIAQVETRLPHRLNIEPF